MQLKKYTLILVILTFVLGVMSTYLIKKNPIEIGIFVENFFKQNTIAYNSGDIQTQTGVQFPEAGDTKE